jgi:hypothetical protein
LTASKTGVVITTSLVACPERLMTTRWPGRIPPDGTSMGTSLDNRHRHIDERYRARPRPVK